MEGPQPPRHPASTSLAADHGQERGISGLDWRPSHPEGGPGGRLAKRGVVKRLVRCGGHSSSGPGRAACKQFTHTWGGVGSLCLLFVCPGCGVGVSGVGVSGWHQDNCPTHYRLCSSVRRSRAGRRAEIHHSRFCLRFMSYCCLLHQWRSAQVGFFVC